MTGSAFAADPVRECEKAGHAASAMSAVAAASQLDCSRGIVSPSYVEANPL
jgi:hypothetical protein